MKCWKHFFHVSDLNVLMIMPFMASNTALRRENRLKQMGACSVLTLKGWRWIRRGKSMQNCLEVLDRKLNGDVHDICYWLIVFLLFLLIYHFPVDKTICIDRKLNWVISYCLSLLCIECLLVFLSYDMPRKCRLYIYYCLFQATVIDFLFVFIIVWFKSLSLIS